MIKEDRNALTRVASGTISGDMLRRYWWPIAVAADVRETPAPITLLDEALVLFRNTAGTLGLLDRYCCHRGASLEFGRVEAEGVRCCYHGWLFDTEGRCLEQPAEPQGSSFRHRVRQPAYKVIEAGGLVFAYLGPEPAPNFPKIDLLFAEDRRRVVWGRDMHSNWLFQAENAADPYHIMVAHAAVYPELAMHRPDVTWDERWYGMEVTSIYPNGVIDRHHEFFPAGIRVNVVRVGEEPAQMMVWLSPIDDARTAAFYVWASESTEPPHTLTSASFQNKPPKSYQRVDDGWFNIVSQDQDDAPIDSINEHTRKEHLGSSDRGVIMYRQMIRRSIELVKKGADPLGVRRGEDADSIIFFESYKRGLESEPGQIRQPEAGQRLGIVAPYEHNKEQVKA